MAAGRPAMRTTDASQLASEVANARSGAQPSGSYVLTASLHPKSFSIAEAADSVEYRSRWWSTACFSRSEATATADATP